MASTSHLIPCLQYSDRRSFLWALASLALVDGKSHKQSEALYRFLTPEFEVEMRVEILPEILDPQLSVPG